MIIDPFIAWSRMVSTGLEMHATWLRSIETLQASQAVIGTRSAILRDVATTHPGTGFGELSRMIPEKLNAFGRSAQAVTRDTLAMHAAWSVQMQRVGRMMFAGRMPTMVEAATLAAQSADYTLAAMTAGAKLGRDALAPVHRAATGNARRLRGRAAH